MGARVPIELGEWYHCHSRGVDKRRIFTNAREYDRFVLQMLVANGTKPVHLSNLKCDKLADALGLKVLDRGESIVEIGAWSLMPNHFHLLLKEVTEGGIARFMQKLTTGYTMYFNKKYSRSGSLLGGTFKSHHIYDDQYFKQVISYIHLNPVELVEPLWKEGAGLIVKIEKFLQGYRYSSLNSFESNSVPERVLLGASVFELYDTLPSTKQMLEDAHAYYQQSNIKVKP